MGQALARAKKETSADKGTCGKLLFSPVNESLLNTIVSFIEQYPGKHGDEAKLRFKNALVWPTELRPADFAGNSAYEERGDDVISLESTVSDGAPVLRLHLDNGVYTMSVYTICELDVVLKVAGGKKMNETRAALEANMDPVAKMTGDRFSATDGEDMAAYRYMEEILRAKEGAAAAAEPEGATEDNSEDKKKTLRLVMHLQKLDTDLLKLYIEGINDVIRLDAQAVEKEVYLLRGFCGEDDEKTANALEDIQFTSDHAFANGCRSPPWRQVYGDIAYIEVRPHDVDKFWVVASTNGYYEMKGYNKESNDYDYERNGDICNSIVTLIKGKSARFTEIISKQTWDSMSRTLHKRQLKMGRS